MNMWKLTALQVIHTRLCILWNKNRGHIIMNVCIGLPFINFTQIKNLNIHRELLYIVRSEAGAGYSLSRCWD